MICMICIAVMKTVDAIPKLSEVFLIIAVLLSFLASAVFCGLALYGSTGEGSLPNFAFDFATILLFLAYVCAYVGFITAVPAFIE